MHALNDRTEFKLLGSPVHLYSTKIPAGLHRKLAHTILIRIRLCVVWRLCLYFINFMSFPSFFDPTIRIHEYCDKNALVKSKLNSLWTKISSIAVINAIEHCSEIFFFHMKISVRFIATIIGRSISIRCEDSWIWLEYAVGKSLCIYNKKCIALVREIFTWLASNGFSALSIFPTMIQTCTRLCIEWIW